ncbi:squamosa promoter-binding-like protein 16 [Canna indica]|uniref:Squamosa promoter-binding-like protein 16 n=1 Tax=Canna indica TaxID=4628 RepID=A0AAQ3QRL2_9LILI|nr:squamosa promoter-binding-like protein 16 [Canna indica]
MDWDLKMPLWDLAELDRDAEPNLGSVVDGPSSGSALRCPVNGLECSVDLKLGGLGDSGSSYKWNEQPRMSTAPVVSSSGPSKRQRVSGSGSQNASCLVDGCRADLSKCRDYHRRHKVCEVHSKTPVVMVRGQEQRFCQQCSRFHLLVEFDEVKRSCRKRLDGHNRRRRKPQPNSVNSGTQLISTYPQVFPSATTESNWAGIIKAEDNTRYTHRMGSDLFDRNPYFRNSPNSYSKERKHFPFLQESETSLSSITTIGSLAGQAHHMTSSTPPSGVVGGSSNSSKILSNGLTQVYHSDCALSLLSSPNQTPNINNLSHMMQQSADQICMGQPLVSSLQYGNNLVQYSHPPAESVLPIGYSCSSMGDARARAVLVSSSNGADTHCGIFRIGDEGSSEGASQALPFSWQQ